MIKAGPTCIIRTPQFKAKAKELNISEDTLARIAYGYQNQEGGKPFPSDSYITEVHNVKNYVTAAELKDALAIWEAKYADEMIGSYEDIDALSVEAQTYFDSRAIGVKPLADGRFQLIINKPEIGKYKEAATPKKETARRVAATEPKTEHERFVANQTALGSQVSFEPSTHTYKIGGKQADYSVTELKDMLLGREKPQRNMYLEISSRLGTTYDNIARDYFADTLQKSYPNVSSEDLQTMKDGLGTLKRRINKKWPGSTIVTDENLLRVAGIVTVNGQQYSVAGTMDMVVIDKNGVVHVLDFKTHRANNDAELSEDAKTGYATQVTLYRELLKAQGYKVDDDNGIVQFNLEYESPNTYQYQLASNSTDLQVKVLLDGEVVNIQDAIAQAGIGGKRIYKGAAFHGMTVLSIEMSEVGVTGITPITTPKYLRKQTATVAKQTRVSESASQTSARTLSRVTPVVFKGSYHTLSNMADKPFTIKGSDGKERTFKSVEQYYQWAKALTAEKYGLANRILAAKTPYQVRRIGEDMGLTDTQEKEWNRKKRAVMKKAMRAAFEQNESAMNSLVESKTTFKAEKEEPFFAELLMELREEFGGVKAPTKEEVKAKAQTKTETVTTTKVEAKPEEKESLEDVQGRIKVDEEYQAEEAQVPSTDVEFEGELVDIETVSTDGSIYTAEYNMVLKRILNLRATEEGETYVSYDITTGAFDGQIAKLLTSFPISSIVRLGAEQGVPNPNVMYLMEMMMDIGYNPIYATEENSITFEEGSISDLYASNLKNLKYNKKTHTLRLPVAFTYGKTNEEIKKSAQRDVLFGSPLFTPKQLRTVSKGIIYQLSHMISQIQGNVNGYEIIMGEQSDKDFTKMSRIEIIRTIGLSNLLDKVKRRVFSSNANDTTETRKRKKLIRDNWQAMLDLGYDTLIGLEEISLTTKSNSTEDIKTEMNDMMGEDDEQTLQELFGSSIEHWQVGFRQVSAFSSLSQTIKRFMDKLYVLDNNGQQNEDEFGLAEHLSAQEAVAHILSWTHGAQSLDDKYEDGTYKSNSMLAMLKSKVDQAPWVTQVIEALEGKRNDEGELVIRPNEEFRSQFYSNFAKYFQKYTITFKDKRGNILIKTINEDQYSDIAIGESQAKENGFALGYFKLRNTDGSINKANMAKLVKLNMHLQKLVEEVSKKGELAEVVDLTDLHATISGMLDMLDITAPTDEVLWATFGTKKAIKAFAKKVNFLIDGNNNEQGITTNEAIANNTKAITNMKDYQDLVKLVVANMGTGMESVSYEAGKMYYSYVTPSYLGRLVTKLRSDYMSDEEYREFIENEYLRYEWFQKTKAEEITLEDGTTRIERRRDGKPRCYWLQKLIASKEARANFEHQVSLHFLGDEYTDKTPAAYIASMVKAFLYDNGHKWAYYRVPMQSNKPSEDYIKFERIHDDFENVIVTRLIDTFQQELDRIQAIKERKEAGAPKKSYDKFGNRFAFLDWLNQYRKGTEEYKEAHANFTEEEQRFSELLSAKIDGEGLHDENNESYELVELFKELSKQAINREYKVAKKQWLDEGFITLDKKGKISKAYAGMQVTEEELREFFWNDMFAAINILELTVTDIAYYKDTEDLQKRLAQIHAPGMRANLSAKDSQGRLFTDGKHRAITIQDDEITSTIIPNLRKAFDNILEKTSDEKEYMRLWQQFNDIIASLEKVNFADAQGFTTPTAYRKKMGIFGKWRENIDEPAYQALMKLRRGEKLAEGEKLSDYIAVLWQPLKPFIYTQIYKDGYVTDTNNAAMPNFKEGRQIKDSEFCLVLADALTRAGGQKSVLNAIFDFMEDTLNTTTGEPNGEGIDTVVFESTQKAVKPVTLNLNGKTYEEALEELGKAVVRSDDGSLWYDEDYVDVMDFADYAIQQEIPVHFIGHKQAQGSQDRVLCWADIRKKDDFGNDNMLEMEIDGVKQQITVEAAQERYFQAIADNISMSTKAVIERFNLKAVDPRLRNIALSRILQDTILKDSRFGADLLWACDTNKYGEFNIPLSDPTQSSRIQQLLNSIIKNEINKQEIAGGPVVQVSSWGRSKNLHIRYQNKEGKILLSEGEFNGTEELPRGYENKFKSKDGYSTYQDYIADQYKTAYYEVVIPIQNYSIAQDFMDENGVVDIEAMEDMNPKLLQAIGYRIPTEAKYSMVPMRIVGFTDANSGEGAMLPAEITWQSGSDFDIDKLYIMTFALNRVKIGNHYIYENPEKGTRQYNDNIIIETQLAILTSNLATEQFYTPGNFEEPKKHGYQISYVQSQVDAIRQEIEDSGITDPQKKEEALKDKLIALYEETSNWSNPKLKDANKTAKNLIFNHTQVQFHKQNMTAGKLIGIFAQANVSHAFISLRDEEKDCFLWIPKENEFEIDGIRVANVSNERGFLVDQINARNGRRISSYLASLLAASVDAVKDPILNLININQETANLVTSMLRMGFSLETVSLLCSQPIFREVVKQYNLRNAQHYTTLNTIIEEYEMLMPEEVLDIKEIKVTNESLVANLAGQDKVTNYMVLEIVRRMQDISTAFRDITHMTRYNSITSAVGPFATDTMLSTMQDEAFFDNPMISAGLVKATRNKVLKYFRLAPKIVERQLLGRNMIQAQYAMFDMLQGLHKMLARDNSTLSSSTANAFSDFFMSYYIMHYGKTFDLSLEHRKYMLQKFPEDFNALKSKYKDNVFLSSIQLVKNDREEFPFLRLKTRGLSGEALEDFKQAWVEAYENPETRDVAIRLVEYAFFRGGFGFNPKTFMNLVPNVVKTGLKGYISSLNENRSMSCGNVMADRILKQFILHHTELISGHYPSIDKYDHTPIGDTEVVISRDPSDEKASRRNNTRLSTKQPFLFLGDDLYYITDRDRETDTYTLVKVDALGGDGQGFEISTTEDFPTTVYSKPKRTDNQVSRGHTSSTTAKLNEEAVGVLMDALFTDEELENLGSSMQVRDAINDKLTENLSYQLPKGASTTRMITKVLNSIKGMSTSEARELLNKAHKTINDLNLCD